MIQKFRNNLNSNTNSTFGGCGNIFLQKYKSVMIVQALLRSSTCMQKYGMYLNLELNKAQNKLDYVCQNASS
jgi:hypothetical protein